jgi:hypothetical protein
MRTVLVLLLAMLHTAASAQSTESKDAVRNGPMTVTEADGTRLTATFKDNQVVGEAEIKFPDGSRYQGQLQDGKLNGLGYMQMAGGCQYEGYFRNNMRDGTGIFVTPVGNRFEGEWKENKPNGKGKLTNRLGGMVEGDWASGKVIGKVQLTYAGSGRREEVASYTDDGFDTCAEQESKRKSYTIKDPSYTVGSKIRRDIVTGLRAPAHKIYEELDADEKLSVKSAYGPMTASDEPPYPLKGLQAIYTLISQAQQRAQVEGDLFLIVQVGADGKGKTVTMIGSPSPEMTKFAAYVVMQAKYKPAVCDGKPCEMPFPFRMKFTMK